MPKPLDHARDDLRAFSELIGQPLSARQADSFTLRRRTTCVVAPRQSGKSRALGVLALHWAFRTPGQLVLIVSASEAAARRLLGEASDVATRSPLLAGSVVDEQAAILRLSNGSTIRSVPASERAIRGYSTDLLIADECAQVEDSILLGAAIPTTAARPDSRIVLASSPQGPEGAFYSFAEDDSEHVEVHRWTLDDAEWIGDEVVAAARAALAPAQFSREYEGSFADVAADERVIAAELIREAQRRELPPSPILFYGADIARKPEGDESVLVRLESTGNARVEWAKRGASTMEQAGRIAALKRDEPDARLTLDSIGLGMGVLDRVRELKVPGVTPFVSSARAGRTDRFLNLRAEAWWVTRQAFMDGTISIPPDDRLLAAQLSSVRYTLTSNGTVQIASKESMRSSPDRADALVMAVYARERGEDFSRYTRALRRSTARARRRSAVSTEEQYANQPTTEERLGGPRRRGWKAALGWDDSLPTIP